MKTPIPVDPQLLCEKDAMLAELREVRERTLAFMEETRNRDLSAYPWWHPFLGSLNASFRSPWQNGVAERWVGSCRRDLLDHIVALNERHVKRLLSEYVRYHHEDRTHQGTPEGRIRSEASGGVLSRERLGGLRHRYNRAA